MWEIIGGLLLALVKFWINRSAATIESKKLFQAFVTKAQKEGLIGRKIYADDKAQDADLDEQKKNDL